MKFIRRLGLSLTVGTAGIAAFAGVAGADRPPFQSGGPGQVVFVQNDAISGNQIVAYDRSPNGSLSMAGTYATGGLGGALTGAVVDDLASQDSLTYDAQDDLLFAVNAGSSTVSVFSVQGDRLFLRQVVGSGGQFPVSIAVRGNIAYVLNAENGGSIQGYVILGGGLVPVGIWNRQLGLNPAATPQFTNTPGEVVFSPDGSKLLVTTKANTNAVDVFNLGPFGTPSTAPVVNVEANAVPFAMAFDQSGHLLVTEAGPNAVASFTLNSDGTITPVSSVLTVQGATCWIVQDGYRPLFFASNAGGPSLSGIGSINGQLQLLGTTTTDPGTVDASVSGNGQFLYVQTGKLGIVDEFQINPGGSLTKIGSVTVPGAVAGEGIVAL